MTSVSADGESPLRPVGFDECLGPLVPEFVLELPHRVAILTAALAAHDRAALSTQVHNLKGAGGTFGLRIITDLASALESRIDAGETLDALTPHVHAFIRALRHVENYDHTRE